MSNITVVVDDDLYASCRADTGEAVPKWILDGGIAVIIVGLVQCFWGLARVCDHYFCKSMKVLCETYKISDNLAGATFMAIGSSAADLIISVFALFLSHSTVGLGTIIGSEIFNHLVISAACVLNADSKRIKLDKAVLIRECIGYAITLLVLMAVLGKGTFYKDKFAQCLSVQWYHGLILIFVYIIYVFVAIYFKNICNYFGYKPRLDESFDAEDDTIPKARIESLSVSAKDSPYKFPKEDGEYSSQSQSSSTDRSYLSQVENRESIGNTKYQLNSIVSAAYSKDLDVDEHYTTKDTKRDKTASADAADPILSLSASDMKAAKGKKFEENKKRIRSTGDVGTLKERLLDLESELDTNADDKVDDNDGSIGHASKASRSSIRSKGSMRSIALVKEEVLQLDSNSHEENDNSLMSKVFFYFFLPLKTLIALTIPDLDFEKNRKYFVFVMVMSCVWMGALAELLLACIDILGRLFGMSPVLIGITISACGASMPTLWSSIVVAKAGFGDMAISNALGANIFSVLVGLGFPWFAYPLYLQGGYDGVQDGGIAPLLLTLLSALIIYYIMIALNNFTISYWMGWVFLAMYGIIIAMTVTIFQGSIK